MGRPLPDFCEFLNSEVVAELEKSPSVKYNYDKSLSALSVPFHYPGQIRLFNDSFRVGSASSAAAPEVYISLRYARSAVSPLLFAIDRAVQLPPRNNILKRSSLSFKLLGDYVEVFTGSR